MGCSASKKKVKKDNKNEKIQQVFKKKEERINEVFICEHAPPISEKVSEKLYNSIVRINLYLNGNRYIGTGFFLKLKINNKIMNFLISCYHIIEEKLVDKKIIITLYYGKFGQEKDFKIKLDRNKRYIKCFNKPIDVTLIEILKEDNINEEKFLRFDWNYKEGYNLYLNDFFYLAGYPQINNEDGRCISSGKMTKILDETEFEHSIDTYNGNSGSPICLANNKLFVVGIHKEGNSFEPINYGTFIGYIVDIIQNEENNKKKGTKTKRKNYGYKMFKK